MRMSEAKQARAKRYLVHFFGTPENAQKGHPTTDRAVDAASLLVATHLSVRSSSVSPIVRAWFDGDKRGETCAHCGVDQPFVLDGRPCLRCLDDERNEVFANGQTVGQRGTW